MFKAEEKRQWWAAVGELLAVCLITLASTATDDDIVDNFNEYLVIYGE